MSVIINSTLGKAIHVYWYDNKTVYNTNDHIAIAQH